MNPHKPSDDLDAIRNGIDDVDQKILQLLAERRSFSVRAARLKGEKGSPSRDRLREEDLIAERIEVGMDHSIDSGLVNRLWREIVDDSVRVQRDLLGRSDGDGGAATVAIQGIDGSYSQLATRQIFAAKGDPEPSYVMCGAFAEAITAVQEGRADKAVLPIENTTSGAISEVYDLLLEGGLHIVGDLRFRVRHCLLGVAGADVDGIRRIYAHPQAAAQCSDFLSGLNECEVVLYEDTAGSGRKTAAMDDRAVAAIASEEAGRLSGLEVLSVSVANRSENYTRFVVVSPEPEAIPTGVPAKTSIVMTVGNHPGALMEALAVFDTADVNLVKLESRPIPTNPTDELFYLDFAGSVADPDVAAMLDRLTAQVHFLRVLGSYPSRDLRPRPDTGEPKVATRRKAAPPEASTRVARGYKLGSRGHKAHNTVVEAGGVRIGEDDLVVIAGPCAVESWDQVMAAARAVKEHGGSILRGGCFKPRTSPYSFQGLGFEGLEMLAEAGKAFGLPIITEVLAPDDVEAVATRADRRMAAGRRIHPGRRQPAGAPL